MSNYPNYLKDKLTSIISNLAENPERFVKNPSKDFTRQRKLTLANIIKVLLAMGGNSIYKELLEYFQYDVDTASTSAFIQQRSKVLPSAFEFIFNEFTNSIDEFKTYNGYRLLAVDGSELNIPHNPNDHNTYVNRKEGHKGYNCLHLNAIYDLCNKLYIDATIQSARERNEYLAFTDMVDRSKIFEKTIIIADRGYESYNNFAHIDNKNWKYVIRVKDKGSNGILSKLTLPKEEEFDTKFDLLLTRRQTKEIKANPEIYRFLPSNSKFDYLVTGSKDFYPISFRVVRFRITDYSYETIITNLDSEDFSAESIKELYQMRWGIETSFRELKYSIGLINFHSKKVDFILQEVFARLTMYNFCEMITLHTIISHKQRKHEYQINFTVAINICKYFFRCNVNPPDVEALIQKNILPVRTGRRNKRNLRPTTAVSFIYRVA